MSACTNNTQHTGWAAVCVTGFIGEWATKVSLVKHMQREQNKSLVIAAAYVKF